MTQFSDKADIPYAELTDPPNMQTYSLGLATALDQLTVAKYDLRSTRDATNPSPTAGDLCYVTEMDAVYQYSSFVNNWVTLTPIFLYKTVDTARSSTTTSTTDPHLQLFVEGSAVYEFEFNVVWDFASSGGGGFIMNFTIPTSGKVSYTQSSGSTGATVFNGVTMNTVGESLDTAGNVSSMSGWDSAGSGSTVSYSHKGGGMLQTSSSGTFGLAWAQHVSSGNATSMKIGSSLKLNKVG